MTDPIPTWAMEMACKIVEDGGLSSRLATDLVGAIAEALSTERTRAESAERERDEARRGLAGVVADLWGRVVYLKEYQPQSVGEVNFLARVSEGPATDALTHLLAEAEERGRESMREEAARAVESFEPYCPRCAAGELSPHNHVADKGELTRQRAEAIRALPTTPPPRTPSHDPDAD